LASANVLKGRSARSFRTCGRAAPLKAGSFIRY
jgi:hypothetical protein